MTLVLKKQHIVLSSLNHEEKEGLSGVPQGDDPVPMFL
jgi:hypothetical protein